MSRLPELHRDEFPEDMRYIWDRLITGSNDNIFLAMGQNPFVLRDWARLNTTLWTRSGIPDRTRELTILRVAYTKRSAYEWHQHVRIGHGVGLTDQEILAVQDWPSHGGFSREERASLAFADAVLDGHSSQTDVVTELASCYDPSTQVSLTMLIGLYAATAEFLAAMEVQTEGPFVGWELKGS